MCGGQPLAAGYWGQKELSERRSRPPAQAGGRERRLDERGGKARCPRRRRQSRRVDASFSTTAAAAESRGTLHEPPPPAEAPPRPPAAPAPRARARGGGRPRAIALERRRKSPCRLADAHGPSVAAAAGELGDRQDLAHAASLEAPAGRLEARAPSRQHSARNNCADASLRRGGRPRPPGRRRGQNAARVRMRRPPAGSSPIRAPRRARPPLRAAQSITMSAPALRMHWEGRRRSANFLRAAAQRGRGECASTRLQISLEGPGRPTKYLAGWYFGLRVTGP